MNKFRIMAIADFKTEIINIKRSIQLGTRKLVITDGGEVKGFVVPLSDLKNIPIESEMTMSLNEFKKEITRIDSSTDCILLTFQTRAIMAFLSPKFTDFMDILLHNN